MIGLSLLTEMVASIEGKPAQIINITFNQFIILVYVYIKNAVVDNFNYPSLEAVCFIVIDSDLVFCLRLLNLKYFQQEFQFQLFLYSQQVTN